MRELLKKINEQMEEADENGRGLSNTKLF